MEKRYWCNVLSKNCMAIAAWISGNCERYNEAREIVDNDENVPLKFVSLLFCHLLMPGRKLPDIPAFAGNVHD